MAVENFVQNINEFEEQLQRIATNMTSGVIFERLTPTELWGRAESSVTSLRNLAEYLMDIMLLLKPERTPTIEKHFRKLMQPLTSFKKTLFDETVDSASRPRVALEHLRKAVVEGSEFLALARSIKKAPSKSITEVLKLREVYNAKEYLSTVPVPETVHIRFISLRKQIENLRFYMASLEKALEDIRVGLEAVLDEISKFRPVSTETLERKGEEEKPVSEPTLIRKDKTA